MNAKPRPRSNGTPAGAFFVSDDEIRDEHRRRSLMADALQTGPARRQAVRALRQEYRVTYWERKGKVIVRREE